MKGLNNVLAILGAQWGDEGKGAVVIEYLKPGSICVRAQGGNNAGHTLYDSEGTKHVVNIAPSGIIFPDVTNVIGNGCVVDLEVLDRNMQGAKGKLFISDAAHLIFDYHRFLDVGQEKSKGSNKIGTTGKGVGPAYADKINRVGIRAGMLKHPEKLEDMLKEMVIAKTVEFLYRDIRKIVHPDDLIKKMRPLFQKYAPTVIDTTDFLQNLRGRTKIILEGAQGSMLDIDHGTYPFVTSSNTTIGGLLTGTGLPRVDKVIGVVKAYSSRVGAGPFLTEMEHGDVVSKFQNKDEYFANCRMNPLQRGIVKAGVVEDHEYDVLVSRYIRENANEFGSTTGRPRRIGWLDIPALNKANFANGFDWLALTRLDNLDGIRKLKICVAYRDEAGDLKNYLPNNLKELENFRPVYEYFNGWENTKGITSYDDLPKEAKAYIGAIQDLTGISLCKVKNGPRQKDYIHLDINPWF